jgi:uncharacterized protein
MKVLITGATGLVGKELAMLLLKNGIHVNYLTTSEDKVQNEVQFKGFYWNPEKGIIDDDCLEDVGTIIHLAGAPISKRWTKEYKQEILESRILSTNVLNSLLKNRPHGVRHFISASAIGIYPHSYDKVYSEDETAVDHSFLGKVVEKWEDAAHQIERLGIKLTLVRTGLVLSGAGGALPEMAAPIKLGVGSAFGSGRQMQSWIHIEDLVNIYYFILTEGLEGVYNAVAPYPVSNNTLMKSIAKVLNKPYFMPRIPRFVMSAMLGEMHTLLFSSQNVSAKKILNEGYHFRYLSLDKALKEALR